MPSSNLSKPDLSEVSVIVAAMPVILISGLGIYSAPQNTVGNDERRRHGQGEVHIPPLASAAATGKLVGGVIGVILTETDSLQTAYTKA